MAFPTTSVLDSFDRADANLTSGDWDGPIRSTGPPNILRILSNQVAMPGSGAGTGEAWYTPATYTECEVFATVAALQDDTYFIDVIARIQAPGTTGTDFYMLELQKNAGTDTWDLYRCTNQSFTLLTTLLSADASAGDKMGLEVTGTGSTVTLRGYRYTGGSWAQIGSDYSDTSADRITSAGYLGLAMSHAGSDPGRFDDFGGGEIVSISLDHADPDADVTTTGWTTTPLWSKVNDSSDATIITATAS